MGTVVAKPAPISAREHEGISLYFKGKINRRMSGGQLPEPPINSAFSVRKMILISSQSEKFWI